MNTKNHRSSYQNSGLPMDHWKKSSSLVPQYHKMGKAVFLELLANTIPRYRNDIPAWLYDSRVFKLVKQHIHDAAVIYQQEIELNHWTSVARMTEPVLTLLKRDCRKFTRQNYIHWDYPQTMKNIQHRINLIKNRLNQHRTMSHYRMKSISYTRLSKAVKDFLHQASTIMIHAQFRNYSTKLNEKLLLLQYDIKDIQLVKSFYGTSPNHDQIEAARSLWRIKHKSGKQPIIPYKKPTEGSAQYHQSGTNVHFHQALDLSRQVHDGQMQQTIHARLANMDQRNEQLLKNFFHD